MIAKLRGLLDGFAADHAVIDVNGIGYLVFASSRTLSALGAVGSEVVVHTEMKVSEDDIRLIGFATAGSGCSIRSRASAPGSRSASSRPSPPTSSARPSRRETAG